jgi:secondary thiamine-phosphate synthase enzyme
MKITNKTIKIHTEKIFDFRDITEEVKGLSQESGVSNGLLNIQIMHTSAALIVNEDEPGLIEDIKEAVERTAPQDITYQHRDNGHSHCKSIFLPNNITLNIVDRFPQLGQWQRIFLVELDSPRLREIQIQIIGE